MFSQLATGLEDAFKISLSPSVTGKDASLSQLVPLTFPIPFFFHSAVVLAPGLVAELLSRPQSQI